MSSRTQSVTSTGNGFASGGGQPVITGVQPGEYLNLKVDHPITSWVSVTSEVAERWLAHNTHNRPYYEANILKFQADMEAHRWKMDGAPIRFSKAPVTLLDGQNRLMALANCVPAQELVFNVIRGLDHETQRTMDVGQTRTPGQQLGLTGQANARQVASVARLVITWENNWLYDSIRQRTVSIPQIEEWVEANQKLVDLFNHHLAKVTRSVGATPSVAGAFAIVGMKIDTPATVSFFNLLKSRANLPEGSPILALDNRLRRVRLERLKLTQRDQLAMFISTWNLWIKGREATKIQSAKGGWTDKSFPVMERTRGRNFDKEQFERGLELAGM